ncbi:hypothetical protein KRR39_08395 [Nocardioides panacis]|uniref:Uncharacterized protein n=1 Tax=Nocardioides panacis TaxID=2849501 RepID=A0A975Y1Q1_9ACTN|nr:hypothetical protein [Nocardioides panacis]QWZ09743.1 hypothetical protein KRR39_08395 [Nocardioides panacis]
MDHLPRSGTLRWSGTLSFHEEARTWIVPFSGTKTLAPRHTKVDRTAEKLTDWVSRMRTHGASFRTLAGSGFRTWLPALRVALGLEPDAPVPLVNVRDPRLLRLELQIVAPQLARRRGAGVTRSPAYPMLPLLAGPPLTLGQLPALSRRTGEPIQLLRRLHALYVVGPVSTRPAWLHPASPRAAGCYPAAGRTGFLGFDRLPVPEEHRDDFRRWLKRSRFAQDWQLTPDGLRLRTCEFCGHHRLSPSRLREVSGAICSRCRRDRAGVPWPAVPYDAYRDRP